MLGLTSCNEEPKQLKFADIVGIYPVEDIVYTINGREYIPTEKELEIEIYGDIDENETEPILILKSDAILIDNFDYVASPQNTELYRIFQDINIKVKKEDNNTFVFEGGFQQNYNVPRFVYMKGKVIVAGDKKKLELNITHNGAAHWSGRTFELNFNNEDILMGLATAPVINYTNEIKSFTFTYKGEEIDKEKLLSDMVEAITNAIKNNSGYEGIRLTFNADNTLEVYFRRADTGEYIKSPYDHFYAFHGDSLYIYSEKAFYDEWKYYTLLPGTQLQPNDWGLTVGHYSIGGREWGVMSAWGVNEWDIPRLRFKCVYCTSFFETMYSPLESFDPDNYLEAAIAHVNKFFRYINVYNLLICNFTEVK